MKRDDTKSILVAGIGNIFMGDDAFGVEVARELSQRSLPPQVRVVDFGIRSYDLAFALTENPDLVILVDAVPRGQPPGTVYLIELDPDQLAELAPPSGDPHSLDTIQVLRMALTMAGQSGRLYLVGCEPATLEPEEGRLGLSEVVELAVRRAADRIESLIADFLSEPQGEKPEVAKSLLKKVNI